MDPPAHLPTTTGTITLVSQLPDPPVHPFHDDDDDDDDDDFVPDSMKEFLQAADRELDANLKGLLQEEDTVISRQRLLVAPSVLADADEDQDDHHDNKTIFQDMLQVETNEYLKQQQQLLLLQQQQLDDLDETFISPPASFHQNPAAGLTHTTARNLAMEGATPLLAAMDEVATVPDTPTIQVTKTGLVACVPLSDKTMTTLTTKGTTSAPQVQPKRPTTSTGHAATTPRSTPSRRRAGHGSNQETPTRISDKNNHHTPNRRPPPKPTTPTHSKATPNSQLQPRDKRLSALEPHAAGQPSPPRPLEIAFDRHGPPSPAFSAKAAAAAKQSPGIPRLLQGTAASRAKTGGRAAGAALSLNGHTSTWDTSKNAVGSNPSPWKGRKKEITSPDKVSSRLLQGTTASKARMALRERMAARSEARAKEQHQQQPKPQKPGTVVLGGGNKPMISARLLQPTLANQVYVASSPTAKMKSSKRYSQLIKESEAVQKQVHEHIQSEQAKESARQVALKESVQDRQRLQAEKRLRMQAALQRAKEKREALVRAENEHYQKKQEELSVKQAKAEERLLVRQKAQQLLVEQKRKLERTKSGKAEGPTDETRNTPLSRVFKPTIPVAPTFRTDARLKTPSSRLQAEPIIPLAASDTILKRMLRSPTSSASAPSRGLTIPKSPKFAKERPPSRPRPSSPKGWESGLRSSGGLASPDRSTASSRLTIPRTPQFSDIKPRARPKSTAEKEAEEMEYFLSHPFKAQPVRMNASSNPRQSTNPTPSRPLTMPSPFVLRTDQRSQSARRGGDRASEQGDATTPSVHQFKARPTPDFSKSTPLTGKRPVTRRPFTTPEPFQFHTDARVRLHSKDDDDAPVPVFKARPMPDFGKHLGLEFQRRFSPRQSEPKDPKPEDQLYQFKARPMPDFFKGVPEIISWSDAFEGNSAQDTTEQPFRARPMPNFDMPSLPVKQRRIPTPPPRKAESEVQPFQARKLPNLSSGPSIPVRERQSTTRERPQSKENKRPSPAENSTAFKARPVPSHSPPRMPVNERRTSKLPSSIGSTHTSRSQSPATMSTPQAKNGSSPVTTPILSSPKWLPSPRQQPEAPAAKNPNPSTAMDRLRQRLKVRGQESGVAPVANSGKNRFSSAQVRSKLAAVAPLASPEPVVAVGKQDSSSPSTNNSNSQVDTGTLTDSESAFHSAADGIHGETTVIDEAPQEMVISAAMVDHGTTPRAGTGVGPMSFGDPMDRLAAAEAKRREQQRLASAQLDQAMKMAMDVQRAAEDELSYHECSVDYGQASYYDEFSAM